MRLGHDCMAACDWAGAIRAYGQGLLEQPLLGMHYATNLERVRNEWRQERQAINHQGPAHTQVVVVAAELSHNAAGRAFTLAQLYQHLGHPVALLGSHFPQWGRQIWEPIQTAVLAAQLPVHTFVAEHEPRYVEQAFELVLQRPADLVHLSKPRLPAVVLGLLYKLLWGAAVLVDIDDEELCFVGEREPITLDGLKRLCHGLPEPRELMGPLWTRLAVDLAQRFDGITVANVPLQQRYGGTVIPHARDPQQLRPATPAEKFASRHYFGVPLVAKVVLFFGTPKRHKGLLSLARAVAQLPQSLYPQLVVVGVFAPEDRDLQQELEMLLPQGRLRLLGDQPFEQAPRVLALADLVVLLGEGDVAAFQSPAKLNDALAMGLTVLVSETAPLRPLLEQGLVLPAHPRFLVDQLQRLLMDDKALQTQGDRARHGFLGSLATAPVAAQLSGVALQALADPKPADGQMVHALESLRPSISSPLMAYRYQWWNDHLIDWIALHQMQRDPELVSIVMPVYGDPEELDGCLKSLLQAHTKLRWELIAVMNDAADDNRNVITRYQRVDGRIKALWPGENVQFALGCNLGFAATQGSWVVFLNNDCRVRPGWLDGLISPLQLDVSVAGVQPRLLKPDGTVQSLGVVFRDGQTLGYPLYGGLDGQLFCTLRDHHLQALTGACLALRAVDVAAVHGFNASFLNSQEDVDLCQRLLALPERRVFLSAASITIEHREGVSPGRYNHVGWSRLRFYLRWRGSIRSDDLAIYSADGMESVYWNADDPAPLGQRIRSGCAVLRQRTSCPKIAIVVHVYYLELWPEISRYLLDIGVEYDLHITCSELLEEVVRETIQKVFPDSQIHVFPNQGMDILPFIRLVPELKTRGYELVCKLHTKKGVEPLGQIWRRHLLDSLVGCPEIVSDIVQIFNADHSVMIAGPSLLYVSAKTVMYENKIMLDKLAKTVFSMGSLPEDWGFFAGSMAWFRVDALMSLAWGVNQSVHLIDHIDECSPNSDGYFSHALERALGWLTSKTCRVALIHVFHPCESGSSRRSYLLNTYAGSSLLSKARAKHLSEILSRLHHYQSGSLQSM
jgi:GT2 family glycosyltransferase/glycosyltransferase involved in cell wall biosynthesis